MKQSKTATQDPLSAVLQPPGPLLPQRHVERILSARPDNLALIIGAPPTTSLCHIWTPTKNWNEIEKNLSVISMMERFPLELKQALLSSLLDVYSLRSAALCCSSFYHAFLSAEELITTQVVKNQLDAEVISEAVIALQSSGQSWTRQGVLDFVDHHLRTRTTPPTSWTLSEALPLSNLHTNVERFTSEFIAEMLNTSSEFAYIDAPPTWPVSKKEMNRIQRTFYRFEVYCNLFHDSKLFEASEIEDLFFSKFSYWENEQLACVHDYLFRVVCPGTKTYDSSQN